ncbi:MAG: hypothetical protein LBT86_03930 [Deltaproteobacteria bacterium]|jgi:hypothetical protein|nr:hypothetical protein [Deltaproteobacteria bacterium]
MEEVKPLQLLYLWRLASSDPVGQDWLQNIQPTLSTKDRKSLSERGLIEESKEKRLDRPKPTQQLRVRLTDQGWEYLANHLTAPLHNRSIYGSKVFSHFLTHLSRFLQGRSLPLVDIFLATPPAPLKPQTTSLEEAVTIIQRYLASVKGQNSRPDQDLRLANLRPKFAQLATELVDAAFIELQTRGFLDLINLANYPDMLTEADKKAALLVDGHPRHLIILK